MYVTNASSREWIASDARETPPAGLTGGIIRALCYCHRSVGASSRHGPASEWPAIAAALVLSALTAVLARPPRDVSFAVGEYHAGFLRGDWSRPVGTARTLSLPGGLSLPLTARRGPLRLDLHGQAPMRAALAVFVAGRPVGQALLPPHRWGEASFEIPPELLGQGGLDLSFALRPVALTRGASEEEPALAVDIVHVSAAGGLALTLPAVLLLAAVPAAFVLLARLAGAGTAWAIVSGALGGLAVVVLARRTPLPLLLAVPRLGTAALLAGLLALAVLPRAPMTSRERAGLAALVVLGVLAHGSLAFLPSAGSQNLEIYVHRALDLGTVSWDYASLLRYGSQLPTPTQPYGAATYALGERTLVPYSPLPSVFYYLLHRAGLDLYWAMSVLNVVLAMLVAPWLWLVAARLWDTRTAWLATPLYALDLAVWHHVGRVHAPAAFGGAMATSALLYLALRVRELDSRKQVVLAGLVLAVAVLGYSSSAVLFGLTGLVLLALATFDARALTPAARRGLVAALIVAGALSGILYYFHYAPGLLTGVPSLEAEPDLVGVKTFFIFHNESRQNLRVWLGGYWILLLVGLLASPFALRRAAAWARPVLVSWLAAWALVMLLKEPFLFPKLLRWAKEDQFLSPLLCLFVSAAVRALPRPWMRWTAAAFALTGALWMAASDFLLNASGKVVL